ncbi:hypothetical protein AVEN_115479-1, partial [Araneus ventricosus]
MHVDSALDDALRMTREATVKQPTQYKCTQGPLRLQKGHRIQ